jgi:hypothetical protein
MEKLDNFTAAYIEAALWSSTGDNGRPLDRDYSLFDISGETVKQMIADCAKFQTENSELFLRATCRRGPGWYSQATQAGHDFWLTRNGHGAGFWDGDWPEPEASLLTEASRKFGEVNLYVGDDGKIYA